MLVNTFGKTFRSALPSAAARALPAAAAHALPARAEPAARVARRPIQDLFLPPNLPYHAAEGIANTHRSISQSSVSPIATPSTSRLAALEATAHFIEGQVGYGVHKCIKMIYAVFKEWGAANVGSLFCSREMQDLLVKEDTYDNNYAAAVLEVNFWKRAFERMDLSMQDLVGAFIGSSFPERIRVFIQSAVARYG